MHRLVVLFVVHELVILQTLNGQEGLIVVVLFETFQDDVERFFEQRFGRRIQARIAPSAEVEEIDGHEYVRLD